MGLSGGAIEARVNVNKLCPPLHSLGNPLEGYWVILGGIGADNHNAIGIPDIYPVIGHSSFAETFRQTGDSSGVSYTGTVFQIDHAEGAVHLRQ